MASCRHLVCIASVFYRYRVDILSASCRHLVGILTASCRYRIGLQSTSCQYLVASCRCPAGILSVSHRAQVSILSISCRHILSVSHQSVSCFSSLPPRSRPPPGARTSVGRRSITAVSILSISCRHRPGLQPISCRYPVGMASIIILSFGILPFHSPPGARSSFRRVFHTITGVHLSRIILRAINIYIETRTTPHPALLSSHYFTVNPTRLRRCLHPLCPPPPA